MGNCKFSNELNRLRKSSSDSIDNIDMFDSFKSYMHVVRTAEEDLKEILRKVNQSPKKTLVLLCGSAGDGKSHLLSYLKNSDDEHLINQYFVYNDATESSSPSKTAIETLNDFLSPFKDANLNEPGQNVILAINLGVLSNFIESKYGDEFSVFRSYVEKSNILTTQVNNNEYDSDSHFQHVSFSDYHMYNLTENGVRARYIENILEKIFCQCDENLFYHTYEETCLTCPLSQKCPVKKNYEYMMKKERQAFVAELLVKTIIQDKVILTTREILNFVYDILVSPKFSYQGFQKLLINDSEYLKEFLKQITPALLFDSTDVTILMNMLKKYDPLLSRTEKTDEEAISYYVSSDVRVDVKNAFVNSPYGDVVCDNTMIAKINSDKELKSILYNIIVRMLAVEDDAVTDDTYSRYLKDMYWYNSGTGKKLRKLYQLIEIAITQWCGSDEDGNLCLDNRHKGFYLYEKVELEPSIEHIPHPAEVEELKRFSPSIIAAFKAPEGEIITLDIDYSLYELLDKLNQGYIQTADDRNNHADFVSFVNRILQTGSLSKNIVVLAENGKKASISQSMFGYKFKVVK